jgi:hypothetical protein
VPISASRQLSGGPARLNLVRLLLLIVLLATLSACAEPSGGTDAGASSSAAPDPAGGGITQAENDLLVEVDRGDGTERARYTLICLRSVDGDHPDAQAACDHLKAMDAPFAPIPGDAMCTEQYGGPQTARVTGLWGGEPVDLELSRVDGCHISQWDSLGPLLPGPIN